MVNNSADTDVLLKGGETVRFGEVTVGSKIYLRGVAEQQMDEVLW